MSEDVVLEEQYVQDFFPTKRTVLVIEDEPLNRDILKEMLSSEYVVLTADNGQTGLDILESEANKIDAVILDVYMPVMDGITFLKTVHHNSKFRFIPIIVVTADHDAEIENKCLDYGATDFLLKPYNAKLVLSRVKNSIRMFEFSNVIKEFERDELTGVYSRVAFIRRAQALIDGNPDKQYAVLGTDFENFKLTNSQYGEDKCNAFLSYVGHMLNEKLQFGFAGRFAGDQFVVIFEYSDITNEDYVRKFISDLLVSAPIPHQIVKVGIYAPIHTDTPVERCCDRAFWAIKEIKGVYNCDIAYYEEHMHDQLLEEQKISDSMEDGLSDEQFHVYYQPKHDSITGKIEGAEALVRWVHPEYGFMSPGKFIPLFEKNGFITKLDKYIVEHVCRDIKRWKEQNIPVAPISVNISRRDYLEPGFINEICSIIKKYEIDFSLIHIEVTESVYAEYMDLIIEQVRTLQKTGFKIEMDDFGAGYSSLGMLATFPLNVIKLDISFVRNIEINKIVIENIVKMAHRMGFITVAEGVETESQFKMLKALGCDLIQGYYFSKPIPAVEYETYVQKNADDFIAKKKDAAISIDDDSDYAETIIKAANELGDTIPGGFFVYHPEEDSQIISVNKEFLKICCCSNIAEFREYTNNSILGFIHPDDFGPLNEYIVSQLQKGNEIITVVHRIICKDGSIKHLKSYMRFMHTEKFGDICYVFTSDMTEEVKKKIEEQKKNEVIQGVSLSFRSIYLIDFNTRQLIPYAYDETFKPFVEEALAKNLNYDDIRISFADRFLSEDDREKVKDIASIEYILKEFEKSDFYSYTFKMNNVDGTQELVELAIRKLKDEHSGTRAVMTYRNVSENMIVSESERNRNLIDKINSVKEQEEIYKQELKASENAVQILLQNLASDIKEPLNDVIGCIHTALDNIDNKRIVKDLLEQGAKSGEYVLRHLNNVFEITQLEEKSLQINEEPIDISMAIEKLLAVIKPEAEKKHLVFDTYLDVYHPIIYQDLQHTAEHTICVLLNAVKYSREGGTVEFGIRQVPGRSENECIIIFTCKDYGIGMSEEFQKIAFNKFAREDNEINRNIPSSGLGLAIVKKIVDSLGGTIELNSKLGEGTEVIISVPHRFIV